MKSNKNITVELMEVDAEIDIVNFRCLQHLFIPNNSTFNWLIRCPYAKIANRKGLRQCLYAKIANRKYFRQGLYAKFVNRKRFCKMF